jgi:hypothetical protein
MSIERGASRIMLKTSFCQFLAKLLIFTNFLHNIGRVLKNDVFGEEMVGIFPATVQIRWIFVPKKGNFQQLISRRRRAHIRITWVYKASRIFTFSNGRGLGSK